MSDSSIDLLRGGRLSELLDEAAEFTSSITDDLILIDVVGKINSAHMLMLYRKGLVKRRDAELCINALCSIPNDLKLDPKLEDVHMNIESFVIGKAGEDSGGQINLGKSRNDQVATAIRMVAREFILTLVEESIELEKVLLSKCKAHTDYLLPSFTHLQRAQPVTLSHHLLAHYDAISRNIDRLMGCFKNVNLSPMGAGAIATVLFDLDRDYVAKTLGFDGLLENSIDAVSTRDFALEILTNISLLMLDVERIANEIVLWSSSEFSFLEVSDEFTSTSSIMPQKKNPVVAEMIRSRTSIVLGDLFASLSIVKSLTLGYNLDLQDLTPRLWDGLRNTIKSVGIMSKMVKTIRFKREQMMASIDESTGAADLANYLAVNSEIPFRKAHHIVGSLAKLSVENGISFRMAIKDGLGDVSMKMIGKDIQIDSSQLDSILDPRKTINSKSTRGGPSPTESERMITDREKQLNLYSELVESKRKALKESQKSLENAINDMIGGD